MPASRFRKIENLHILLWIVKDACWVADFKIFGTIMIFPTVGVAVWLTIRMRDKYEELMHNLTVIAWICANATWMIGEFYFDDGTRPVALVFFFIGISFLAIYYLPLLFRKFFR